MNELINNYKVVDRKTFTEFIEALRQDLLNNPNTLENKTLPDFLEAIGSYAEDIQGYYDNMKLDTNADKPSWQTFADIFKGASIYE